ncbi:MBL fold metallo-hydrolase [Pseudooceanicola nanhaiensis]|uniref:MBL fold metallo-hydrolase n=1 Tax=Pseudooceanicola nanhaiensis TaxID=375761 RepID=UPI001CD74B04|nr:MBL fold metallo-hydrolase [Pseudooceanicola nanhaiensis]MCA0922287.1 MBL fold metallo-hydrolase [Pseudooceanicola nanhaiensis]
MLPRRTFLAVAAAGAATTVFRPTALMAQAGASDSYATDGGEVVIRPVSHASFVMETPSGVIYCDPVGEAAQYEDMPAPDLILITHEHGDHYNADTLAALVGASTQLVTNPAVYEKMPDGLKARATALANGEKAMVIGVDIDAVPAYNTTEERKQYHPEGRDNGYVLNIDGLTVYIAGDTEDTREMRALTDIDVAFVPMNLPYTMTEEQAASGVAAFAPKVVYPYHYRDSDPEKFAQLLSDEGAETEVVIGPWYG